MPWQGLGNRLSTPWHRILSIFVRREQRSTLSQHIRDASVRLCVDAMGLMLTRRKKYSWKVNTFWRRAQLRACQERTFAHAPTRKNPGQTMWHTKHGGFPQERVGLRGLGETKCEKCSGPSHEWSNRSILCLMAVRSPMDAVRLHTSLLSVCAHSRDLQCGGHCGVLFPRLLRLGE